MSSFLSFLDPPFGMLGAWLQSAGERFLLSAAMKRIQKWSTWTTFVSGGLLAVIGPRRFARKLFFFSSIGLPLKSFQLPSVFLTALFWCFLFPWGRTRAWSLPKIKAGFRVITYLHLLGYSRQVVSFPACKRVDRPARWPLPALVRVGAPFLLLGEMPLCPRAAAREEGVLGPIESCRGPMKFESFIFFGSPVFFTALLFQAQGRKPPSRQKGQKQRTKAAGQGYAFRADATRLMQGLFSLLD